MHPTGGLEARLPWAGSHLGCFHLSLLALRLGAHASPCRRVPLILLEDYAADERASRMGSSASTDRSSAAHVSSLFSRRQRVVHEEAAVVAHQMRRSAPSNLMREAVLLQYAVDTQLDSALKVRAMLRSDVLSP
jgi:hypothetical protein